MTADVHNNRDLLPQMESARRDRPSPVGLCLRCGRSLTLCGETFTLEVRCDKCFAINVYEDSQQPVRLK